MMTPNRLTDAIAAAEQFELAIAELIRRNPDRRQQIDDFAGPVRQSHADAISRAIVGDRPSIRRWLRLQITRARVFLVRAERPDTGADPAPVTKRSTP